MSSGFKPIPGDGLSPDQEDAVDSIINAPDDQLLLARSGVLQASTAFQSAGDTTIKNDVGAYEAGPSPGYKLGLAWTLNSAGQNVNFTNEGTNDNFHPVWQKYLVGRENIFARNRFGTVDVPIETVFTDQLTNPTWTIVVPSISTEEGQTAVYSDVKFDAASVVTNLKIIVNINGTDYREILVNTAAIGDFRFFYDPPTDFFVGDTLTFSISSVDGDVILLGNNATLQPFNTTKVLLWDDVSVGLLSDNIPHYFNSLSVAPTAMDGQTYAADGSLGGFTILADPSASSFSVFDYAGNWNSSSRRITVSIGVDSYFLTRRNREYFFYKDESNNWQWYYKANFRG